MCTVLRMSYFCNFFITHKNNIDNGISLCISITTNNTFIIYIMESHIKKVTQSCHFQLKNVGKIRDLLDKDIAHMLVHSFVTNRLDYCNCLYAGVPSYLLERLQKIQNKAARLVLREGRKHDSKELLRLLHWLPVQKRVDFKIACLVFKSLNNLSPSYIQDLIEMFENRVF